MEVSVKKQIWDIMQEPNDKRVKVLVMRAILTKISVDKVVVKVFLNDTIQAQVRIMQQKPKLPNVNQITTVRME